MSSQVNILETAPTAQARRSPLEKLLLFCLAHFFVDMYSIALGVLQPLLLKHFSLSLTQAGWLGGTLVFSSSLMQPVYGLLSDRFHSRLFTVLAPALSAVFLCTLGLAPNYGVLLAMVWLGGAGVAAFHPQATANATVGIDTSRGRAMAIFICAGTIGLAIGPLYFSALSARLGLERLWWGAIPGIAVSCVLFFFLHFSEADRPRVAFDWAPLKAVWKELTILYLLVFVRSIVQISFAQFLPLYLSLQRGYSLAHASYLTSAYLLFGAIGGFAGGNLADRFGGKRVIEISMIGSVPFLLMFVLTDGIASIAGLVIGGLFLLFTIPVNVVMGQQLVPSQAGTISALMMGFAWGLAGLVFIPLVGWFSDHYSMQWAFIALVLFPLLGYLLALKLPKRQRT
jgi:FSR family fosmidomycin resistance protein-like MFS transporter